MQMIRGKCKACAWEFDLVTAPMPLTKWARAAQERSTCPMCGHRDGNTLAPERPLTDAEREHKLVTMAREATG